MRIRSKNSGFTLVEMMVALLLLSMISIVGYQGIVFAMKQWGAGEQKLSNDFNRYQSYKMMRNKLSSIERVTHSTNGKYVLSFVGKHKSLKFVSRFKNINQGGLYVCEFYGNKELKNIELTYGLLHPENGGFLKIKDIRRTEVLKDSKGIVFWYFGSWYGENKKWHRQWSSETQLPNMIKYIVIDDNNKKTESVIYVETAGA